MYLVWGNMFSDLLFLEKATSVQILEKKGISSE